MLEEFILARDLVVAVVVVIVVVVVVMTPIASICAAVNKLPNMVLKQAVPDVVALVGENATSVHVSSHEPVIVWPKVASQDKTFLKRIQKKKWFIFM